MEMACHKGRFPFPTMVPALPPRPPTTSPLPPGHPSTSTLEGWVLIQGKYDKRKVWAQQLPLNVEGEEALHKTTSEAAVAEPSAVAPSGSQQEKLAKYAMAAEGGGTAPSWSPSQRMPQMEPPQPLCHLCPPSTLRQLLP